MSKLREDYGKIGKLLSAWHGEMNIFGAIDLHDLKRLAEKIVIPLLEIAFNEQFIHLDEIKHNHPAIDLGSKSKELAIQITANKDVNKKVKKTLITYANKKLHETYKQVIFLFLDDRVTYSLTKSSLNKHIKNKTKENIGIDEIGFYLDSSIINLCDLARKLTAYSKEQYMSDIIGYLEDELKYLNLRKKFSELKALNEEIQHLNIVDALYTLTQKLTGLYYLPNRFKRQVYPFFKKINEYHNEVANFYFDCCKTWNEEFVEFLCYTDEFKDKFEYVGENTTLKNVKIDKIKIDTIFKFLGNNNINIIQYGSGHSKQVFELHNYQLHACNYHSFKKLNFKKSLNEIRINLRCSDNNLYKLLQKAYFLFRFGFLKKSFAQLEKLSKYSKKNNYHLLHFVCEYNIVYLQNKLTKHYTDEWEGFTNKEKERILKRNNENNLYDLISGFQDANVNKDIVQILQLIKDDLYIEEFAYTSSVILEYSLKRHYDESLWFKEENNEQLINEIKFNVYECKNIVFGNFLFNSESQKFKDIVYKSIEALISLLQLNKKKNTEAIPMEDFFIDLMVFYFQSHDLLKFLEKYEVHKIDIVKTNPDQNFDIIEVLQNFTNSKDSLKVVIEEQNKDGAENFKYEFPQLLDNLIILTHYLNLDDNIFNEAIKYIVQILCIIEVRGTFHNPFYYLFKIVDLDRHRLSKENLKAIVQLKKLHKKVEFEFYNLYDLPQFNSDKNSFINKQIKYFKKPPKRLSPYDYFKIYEYENLCSTTQKKEFIKIIEDKLDQEFGLYMFYSFCLNGYLPFEKYKNKFLELVKNIFEKEGFTEDGTKSFHPTTIDMLINLAYQNKLYLKGKIYQQIKQLYQKQLASIPKRVNYCEFLFDPQKFKYENFEVEWLLEYPYWRMKKLSKIKAVKDALLKEINKSDNKELALLYVNYVVKPSKG